MKIDSRILAMLNVLFLVLSIGAGVFLVTTSVDTQSQASLINSLTLEAADTDLAIGERMAVTLVLDSERSPVDDIYAVVLYDPTILRYISGSAGNYFAPESMHQIKPTIHGIEIQYRQASSAQPVADRGTVALLIFERIAAGEHTLIVSPDSQTRIQNDDNNFVQSYGELVVR